MDKRTRVLVTGAGGFIGSHLVKFLIKKDTGCAGLISRSRNSAKA